MALTQGLGASLAGIVPFCALDLALYSSAKEWVAQRADGPPSSLALFACGACSSAIAQVVTYPLALLRTVLQAGGMPGHPRYGGMYEAAQATVRHGGGLGALYRGLRPNMMKAVPSISLSYVVFENVKRLLA